MTNAWPELSTVPQQPDPHTPVIADGDHSILSWDHHGTVHLIRAALQLVHQLGLGNVLVVVHLQCLVNQFKVQGLV